MSKQTGRQQYFFTVMFIFSGVETTLYCSYYTYLCSYSKENWKGDSDWRWGVRVGSSKTAAEFWDGCDCSGGKSKYIFLR